MLARNTLYRALFDERKPLRYGIRRIARGVHRMRPTSPTKNSGHATFCISRMLFRRNTHERTLPSTHEETTAVGTVLRLRYHPL